MPVIVIYANYMLHGTRRVSAYVIQTGLGAIVLYIVVNVISFAMAALDRPRMTAKNV